MTQQTLHFDAPLAREAVRKVLTESWLANHELPKAVHEITGEWYSEGGLSARVRDLRKPKYGGLYIPKRPVAGKSYYEYKIMEAA